MLPYGRQEVTQADIDSVIDVLKSDFLTQGPRVSDFEQEVSNYCGAEFGVAVNSGTSALHVACLALGLGPGDWLWTTPITFVASSNCGLYCGAKVDFVDIDMQTYNLSHKSLEEKLIHAEKEGCLPKIVIPVHLCGQSCDMYEIYKLSRKYGFKIIEDASHGIGGKYKGDFIGNGKYSDITVFSFHPVKIITTGEGGMAVTNNEELAQKMRLLRSHGITRDPDIINRKSDGPWYYQQNDLGFNYRMTDIQASIGVSQIKRIDSYVAKRHEIAELYNRDLIDLPINIPVQKHCNYSSYHLYVIRVDQDVVAIKKRELFEKLIQAGIGVNLHYIPIYRQPYYCKFNFKKKNYPNSERYYQEAISLPIFPTLKKIEQKHIISTLRTLLKK